MSTDVLREILVRVVPLGALVAVPFLVGMLLRRLKSRLAIQPEVYLTPADVLDAELLDAVRRLEPEIERLGFRRVAALRSPSLYTWEDETGDWEEILYVNTATLESCSVYRFADLEHVRFPTESSSGPYVETEQLLAAGATPDLARLSEHHQERVARTLPAGCGRHVPSGETAAEWLGGHLTEMTEVMSRAGWAAAADGHWYRLTLRGAAAATWEHWRDLLRREPPPAPPPGGGFDVLPR